MSQLAVKQVGELVGEVDREVHRRMCGEEGRQVRHDVHAPERGGRGDAQGAAHMGMATTDTLFRRF